MKIIAYKGTKNLGDAIQTLALMEFCKQYRIRIDGYVFRQELEPNMLINGWHRNQNEPLPPKAIFCGIHADREKVSNIDHKCLIGCRDTWTYSNCQQSQKTQSLITGCVTINFPLSTQIKKNTLFIHSKYSEKNNYCQYIPKYISWSRQLELAQHRIDIISRAELVHTKKLHVLLPCIAMGIPVILDEIPIDANEDTSSPRFSLIEKFIKPNTVIDISSGIRDILLNIWNTNIEKILDHHSKDIDFL
jgi:hypothetical protein